MLKDLRDKFYKLLTLGVFDSGVAEKDTPQYAEMLKIKNIILFFFGLRVLFNRMIYLSLIGIIRSGARSPDYGVLS